MADNNTNADNTNNATDNVTDGASPHTNRKFVICVLLLICVILLLLLAPLLVLEPDQQCASQIGQNASSNLQTGAGPDAGGASCSTGETISPATTGETISSAPTTAPASNSTNVIGGAPTDLHQAPSGAQSTSGEIQDNSVTIQWQDRAAEANNSTGPPAAKQSAKLIEAAGSDHSKHHHHYASTSTTGPPARGAPSAGYDDDQQSSGNNAAQWPSAPVEPNTNDSTTEVNTCPRGEFSCGPGTLQCIDQKLQCNGITDCDSGKDERDCDPLSGAMKEFFSDLVQYSKTHQIGSGDDSLRPRNCSLDDFKIDKCICDLTDPNVVICTNQQLRTIPDNLAPTLKKLRVNNNLIEIVNYSFHASLEYLHLNNNSIRTITLNAFRNARNLSKLYLEHNQLTTIDPEAFASLTSLTSLSCANNKLVTFDPRWLKNSPMLRKLSLENNFIRLPADAQFRQFPELGWLYLSNNSIEYISKNMFSNMTNLSWFELENNKITYIEPGSLDNNLKLAELQLQHNLITNLSRSMFPGKGIKLENLKLDFNPINSLPVDVFDGMTELVKLYLDGITINNISVDHFENRNLINLTKITFIKYRYCHFARIVRVCRPNTDGVSNDEHLLIYPLLRYAVWIVAFVCCCGNVSVLIWRLISKHENKSVSIFIKNLSVADLMMGLYLCAIGYADQVYREKYNQKAYDWMSSWPCTAIGFLAMLSSELSLLMLLLITIERYRSFTATYYNDQLASRSLLYISLVWLVSLVIASYPIARWSTTGDEVYYATNGLCLPLHIHEPFSSGWIYSAFIFVGLNFLAVLVIICLYGRMYVLLRRTSRLAKPAALSGKRKEDAILAARFFFIVVADCLCWLPIVAIKLVALLSVDTPIPAKVYTWIAVFILPINSALNPIIYTLAAPTGLHEIACALMNRLYYRFEALFSARCKQTARHQHHKSILLHKKRKDTSASSATCDTLAISDTAKSSTAGLLANADNSSVNSRHSCAAQGPCSNLNLSGPHLLCACYRLIDKIFKSSNSNNDNTNNNNNRKYTTTAQLAATSELRPKLTDDSVAEQTGAILEREPLAPPPPPYNNNNDSNNSYNSRQDNMSFVAPSHHDNHMPALVVIQTDASNSGHTVSAVVRDTSAQSAPSTTTTTTTTMIAINYITNNALPSGPTQLTLPTNNRNCLAAAIQSATTATLAIRGINL